MSKVTPTQPARAEQRVAKQLPATPEILPPAADGDDEEVADDDDEDVANGGDDAEVVVTTKKAPARHAADDDSDDAPAVDRDADLSIKRLTMSTGVNDREPVGTAATFTAGAQERIYAFIEVSNPAQVESEVFVVFQSEGGRERAGVRVRVGPASRWRTWATSRHATKPGKWQAVVRDTKGRELARASFTVARGSEPPDSKADAEPLSDRGPAR